MLCSEAGVTVSAAVPEIEFRVAVSVEVPVCSVLTWPVPLIVATLADEELHCTCEVISIVVPSV